jgi:hypothetical protein
MKRAAAELMDDEPRGLAAAAAGLQRTRDVFPLQGEAEKLAEIYRQMIGRA